MKVGIYNRHLMGVGGGEKHMLAIAEVLSRHFPVDVLTHRILDLEQAGANLGVDLSRARLRPLTDQPDPELAPVTADYDLFINASDGTFVPSQAPRSLLLVYFPTPAGNSPWTRLKWHVGHHLRRLLSVPSYVAGVYGPEKLGQTTVRWTKSRAQLEIPAPPGVGALEVRLTLTSDRYVEPLELLAGGDLASSCAVPAGVMTSVTVSLPVKKGTPTVLSIATNRSNRSDDKYDRGIAIVDVQVEVPRFRLYRLIFQHWFRELGQRLDSLYPVLNVKHLDTYDTICANSAYTQGWIERYWGKSSVVFYPPVDVDWARPQPKRRQILSVGRFFTAGHNKKHLVMIRAFREMLDAGLSGWELHLAGGTSLGAANTDYLAQVRQAAASAPIFIHTDVSLEALRQLYIQSAIYWHAAGFGEDPQRHPVRYEHFGLTTVEAMAAGAVPVVIDRGGQPEIVTQGIDGFLWTSLDQLRALTRQLIESPERRRQMADAARERSHAFGQEVFEARLWQILGEVM